MGRNWDYSKQKGREKRLEAELNALHGGEPVPENPPLFSHDATMQSYFEKSWNRVTPTEINLHLGRSKAPKGNTLFSKIRSLRHEHLELR